MKKSVQAVSFCGEDLLACGCDDGTVMFFKWDKENIEWISKIDEKVGATKAISCLAYKNGRLGVGSYDNSVRIFRLDKH